MSVTPITVELLARQLAQTQQQPPLPEDPLGAEAKSYEYRVAPHDVLSVIVWDHPELTIPAGEFRSAEVVGHPVTSDGTMFYPHVGVVQVAGKTLSEIRALLTERLTRYVERPQLDVKVVAFRGYRVQVTGEVLAATTVPITDVPLRALDAIAAAKGPGPEADLSNVVLSRDGKTYRLDLQAANELGVVSQNWLLKDGDILHVPDRSRNKVFVMGEVKRPSSRLMVKGRMTLADAINDAEGFDPVTSNPSGVYVFRGSYDKPSIYRLDATSPDALLLASAFELKQRDVVYVSSYPLTQWNRVVTQILPTAQLLWQTTNAAASAASFGKAVFPIVVPAPTTASP